MGKASAIVLVPEPGFSAVFLVRANRYRVYFRGGKHVIVRILRRMRVGQRLATGFGIVLALMMVLTGVALYGFGELHHINEQLSQQAKAAGMAAASAQLYESLRAAVLIAGVLAAVVSVFFSWRVGRMITRPINRAVSVSEGIAQGDLTQQIDVNHHGGELGQLLLSLQNTVLRLRALIEGVRDKAQSVQYGTDEIARGNASLSARTEAQASMLEQTAASMEEFTASIKKNAEHANQARALAIGAAEIAVEGGNTVSDAVQTMAGISDASKKIADIIGVIDGIAFQTNILALNAAVEAARAGEQGRGFAVVASEVRSLAQRSAEAAKEIKALIGDSVLKISTGARQVQNAGSTMNEIVESVARVRDVVTQISNASREQASGIDQVTAAVLQMDQTTQQNAALVEQVSATAESMTSQSRELMQALSAFNLGKMVLKDRDETARGHRIERADRDGARAADTGADVAGASRQGQGVKSRISAPPESAHRLTAPSPVENAGDGDWKSF